MKRVEETDPSTMKREVLATFELVGERVVATFNDPAYQLEVEAFGLFTRKTGKVKPNDGRAFYEALDTAYSRSSFRHVVIDD